MSSEVCSEIVKMHLRASYFKNSPGEHALAPPLAWLHAYGARFRAFGAQLYFSLSAFHRDGESPSLEINKLEPHQYL